MVVDLPTDTLDVTFLSGPSIAANIFIFNGENKKTKNVRRAMIENYRETIALLASHCSYNWPALRDIITRRMRTLR